jgi:hypothetical protein
MRSPGYIGCSTRARTDPLLQTTATNGLSTILNRARTAGERNWVRTSDPSLVRYAHVVGTHRWPGSPSLPRSARVGRTPIALWSDVVVSHAVAEALGIPMGAAEKGGRAYETDGCGVTCC